MREQMLGKSDVKISPIIMGMSRSTKTNFDKLEIVKSVQAGFDAGITTFDTAELYFTEQVLGEALSDVRESVVYATKVSPENLNYHQLNAKAADINLSDDDLQKIDAIGRIVTDLMT